MSERDENRQGTGYLIEEADIERLVRTFYGRAREDEILGPVFAAHVEDWEHHLLRIRDFWSSVVLRSGRYRGRPVPAHVPLPIDAAHFDRWLELFEKTALDVFPPPAAGIFVERARMIAASLEMAMATHAGMILPPGGRYRRSAGDAPS
jgi:hemoglobin